MYECIYPLRASPSTLFVDIIYILYFNNLKIEIFFINLLIRIKININRLNFFF